MGSAKTGRIVNPELVLVGLRQIPRKPTRRGERRAALVRAAAAPVVCCLGAVPAAAPASAVRALFVGWRRLLESQMSGRVIGWRARVRLGLGVIVACARVASASGAAADAAPVRHPGPGRATSRRYRRRSRSRHDRACRCGVPRYSVCGSAGRPAALASSACACPLAGVRDATQFGPHCPQSASPFGVAGMSENCLYLNVFTPLGARRDGARGLPVMVWIHGGDLTTGESDDYIPAGLVRARAPATK